MATFSLTWTYLALFLLVGPALAKTGEGDASTDGGEQVPPEVSVSVEIGKPGTLTCPSNRFIHVTSAKFAAIGSATDSCNGAKSVLVPVATKCWEQSKCSVAVKTTPTGLPSSCKWSKRPLTVKYSCDEEKHRPVGTRRIGGDEASLID